MLVQFHNNVEKQKRFATSILEFDLAMAMVHSRAKGGVNRGAAGFNRHVGVSVGKIAVGATQITAIGNVEPSCQSMWLFNGGSWFFAWIDQES